MYTPLPELVEVAPRVRERRVDALDVYVWPRDHDVPPLVAVAPHLNNDECDITTTTTTITITTTTTTTTITTTTTTNNDMINISPNTHMRMRCAAPRRRGPTPERAYDTDG